VANLISIPITVEYKLIQTPDGFENYLGLSMAPVKKIKHSETQREASFVAKILPPEFRIEHNAPRIEKKLELVDAYNLDCKQASDKSSH
jgi:hypothetical protein